jgi:hypothetical protein
MAEKEPAPTGHQPRGNAPQRTPEQEELSNRIQEHQRGAARLSKTEEVSSSLWLLNSSVLAVAFSCCLNFIHDDADKKNLKKGSKLLLDLCAIDGCCDLIVFVVNQSSDTMTNHFFHSMFITYRCAL